jgi:hypothetical protein
MSLHTLAAFALLTIPAAAQTPLPVLRIEPTTGGSIFYVRNGSSQPLTAYLIELVGYPGSSYSFFQDDPADPIPPGAEKRIQVANMTVGAVPDYVKMQAAVYADGTSAGIPEKASQIIERRRAILETTRELIRRCEKAKTDGVAKTALAADLKQWAASLQPAGKGNRASVSQAATRAVVADTAASLESQSLEHALEVLHASERTFAASKPAL